MMPILYILMRTDLDSMNPGKGMAQACHAANYFIAHAKEVIASPDTFIGMHAVKTWQEETPQGFGTTIVLAVGDEAALNYYTSSAEDEGLLNGVVHDPSYPIRDGSVTHELPLDTCGFVFSPEGPLDILSKLSLHP